MDITENKLQQIIIEELKEVLGMDQEYTGSEMDVDAENDLAGALMALQQAGYSREEVVEMVNNEFGEASDSGKVDPNWARQKYAPMKGDKTRYSKHLEEPMEENCGCPSCPEHGSGAKIRVKVK